MSVEDEELYISGVLNERRHKDDHEYLKNERDRRKQKKIFWGKVFSSFITGAMLMVLSSVLAAISWSIKIFIEQGHIK